jgi:hypothetical protein
MPFLSRDEFDAFAPNARHYVKSSEAFEAAERDAAQVASRLSGYPVPEDAADAPEDVKRPVAHLALFTLSLGMKLSDEEARTLRYLQKQAREDLAALRTARASTGGEDTSERTGALEALPTW